MSELPNHLRYSKSHEWARLEDDETLTIGITDHAQSQLGDLVFIELPSIDSDVTSGEEVVVLESVKTAADVYAPVAGTIVAVNENLGAEPGTVNQDPYGAGWMFRIKPSDNQALEALLDAKAYQALIQD